jgi:hypothetical protein
VRVVLRILLGVAVTAMTAWAVGAIYYSPLPGAGLRATLAILFIASTVLAFVLLPDRRRTLFGFFVAFAVVLTLWLQIRASNGRDWQPEVAVAPYAVINGDLVTIQGVRNLEYRTETDFTPRWETRTYDLRKLDSVDLVAVYWAGKAIAHIMLSFGFAGQDFVTISIETRKERNESYSTIAGFFKQYELIYIVGDERDLIGVRTNYRQPQEDVYVYRVSAPRENMRRGFLDNIKAMNEMRERPRFYNTLTTNCTTGAWMHTRMNPESPPFSWKILLSGYVPDYLYELGRLDKTKPFAELERISRVNERARAAGADAAFSRRIREGLPDPGVTP